MEQLGVRMSWPIEIRLKVQPHTNKTKLIDNDGKGEAWPIPIACTLEPLARLMWWWGVLGNDKLETIEGLVAIWFEVSESKIQNYTTEIGR